MDFLSLIPTPDTIPAPAWLFLVLDLVTFTLHILVINLILGGSLITLYNRMVRGGEARQAALHAPATGKLPTLFAIGINLGVAPLLFLQVIYGHLFYTSSVLMAVYWILVIPFLILAYYGAYIHSRRYDAAPLLSKTALWVMTLLVPYVPISPFALYPNSPLFSLFFLSLTHLLLLSSPLPPFPPSPTFSYLPVLSLHASPLPSTCMESH